LIVAHWDTFWLISFYYRGMAAPPAAQPRSFDVRKGLAALAVTTVLLPLPGGGARASGDAGSAVLHLVPMDQMTVPIIEADRLAGEMRFRLVLETTTAEAAGKVREEMPELRAATLAAAAEFAGLNASGMRAVDAERLDRELGAALKAVEPGLSRVLIVEISARR
jgi:hypothetical protein